MKEESRREKMEQEDEEKEGQGGDKRPFSKCISRLSLLIINFTH